MEIACTLSKMATQPTTPVSYLLLADNDFVKVNSFIGKEIGIRFLHEKYCEGCGNQFKELYRMGFCRNCFFTNPQAGESIIRPELSRAHEGIEDRDLAFEKAYQLQPHVVYLANSGGLKVGVTRGNQKLHRWMDQGASSAIVLAETTNRFEAGQLEVMLKAHLSDKTVWQRMLKNEEEVLDLSEEKKRIASLIEGDLQRFVSVSDEVYTFTYPVAHFPTKVKSINLDKTDTLSAVLQGIRGQYLMFEGGAVINLRAHSGYRVAFTF
jgi:hypothetical protein